MWVANSEESTVTELGLDGAIIGTYNPGGYTPTTFAFDGTNMWSRTTPPIR